MPEQNINTPIDSHLAGLPPQALVAEIARLKHDLAEAERRIADLELLADVDPLLEIPNRRGFERELTRSLAYVKRYGTAAALMFIDLDGFKPVNDRHGHAAGDALLKAVAATLVSRVRASDIVARLGGDEFGLLMWHADLALVAAKASELERIVAQARVDFGGVTLSVGASAGAVVLRAEASASQMIDEADRAMYVRKNAKRAQGVA